MAPPLRCVPPLEVAGELLNPGGPAVANGFGLLFGLLLGGSRLVTVLCGGVSSELALWLLSVLRGVLVIVLVLPFTTLVCVVGLPCTCLVLGLDCFCLLAPPPLFLPGGLLLLLLLFFPLSLSPLLPFLLPLFCGPFLLAFCPPLSGELAAELCCCSRRRSRTTRACTRPSRRPMHTALW